MSAEPEPQRADIRASDADRESVAERLRVAAGEGRLAIEELERRLEAAYYARTYGELQPLAADLPAPGSPADPGSGETGVIQQTGARIVRQGRWSVPRRLVVRSRYGSALLDLSEARIEHADVEIVLERQYGSTRIVVPRGATVDTDALEMSWGSVKNHAAAAEGAPRFRVTGAHEWGSVTVHQARRVRLGPLTIHFPLRFTWRQRRG